MALGESCAIYYKYSNINNISYLLRYVVTLYKMRRVPAFITQEGSKYISAAVRALLGTRVLTYNLHGLIGGRGRQHFVELLRIVTCMTRRRGICCLFVIWQQI